MLLEAGCRKRGRWKGEGGSIDKGTGRERKRKEQDSAAAGGWRRIEGGWGVRGKIHGKIAWLLWLQHELSPVSACFLLAAFHNSFILGGDTALSLCAPSLMPRTHVAFFSFLLLPPPPFRPPANSSRLPTAPYLSPFISLSLCSYDEQQSRHTRTDTLEACPIDLRARQRARCPDHRGILRWLV